MESPKESTINPEADLSFEKKEHKPSVLLYAFKNVVIGIDTTGKNYKEKPELLFGTYDAEYDIDAMSQPELKREGVDMTYISKCIREVAKDGGYDEFWIYPYGEDADGEKNKREAARLRLFKRYANITPAPGGFGYILNIG